MQMSKMMIRRSLNTLRLPKISDESSGLLKSADIQENLIEVSHQILGDRQTEINNADISTYAVEDGSNTWMSRASSVQKSRLTLISARDSRGEPLVRNPRLDKLFSVVFKHNTPFQTDQYSSGLILRPQRRSSKQQLKPIMKRAQSNDSQLIVAKTTTELSNRTILEEPFMLSREDTLPSSLPYTKQKSIYIDDRPIGLQFNVKKEMISVHLKNIYIN